MMSATALLLLALAVPAGEAKPAATTADGAHRPESLVASALESVRARLVVLEELRRRRAAGESISMNALRTLGRGKPASSETLAREKSRIDALLDEIRILEARARRTAKVETAPETAERPAESKKDETAGTKPVAEKPKVEKKAPPIVPALLDEAAMRLANSRYRSEDYAGALPIYEKASKSGTNTWARLRRARCLERLGRKTAAREAYQALVAEYPEDRWGKAARWSLNLMVIAENLAGEGE